MSTSSDPGVRAGLPATTQWPWLAARGAIAVLLGVLTLAWPAITLLALVALFGAYAFLDGLGSLAAARAEADRRHRLARVALGVLGIGAGVVSVVMPGATAYALALLVAAWAILTGVAEIVAAVRLRTVIRGELLLGLAGAASVLLGVLLVLRPDIGALALAVTVGVYALIAGALLLALALRLRSMRRHG